ncbi:MAG: OmpA family protein, partial [Proteobacteria bacterium]|nr:OmpA family protein [Pseudomonadota bacterium]
TGGLVALALGAALVRRRRRHRTAVALAAALVPSLAAADGAQNLDVGVFNPTPTTINGTWNVQTADVGVDGDWVAGAMVSYASKPLVANFSMPGLAPAELIAGRTMYEIGGAYAFLGRFEAGLRMPLYTQNGTTSTADGDRIAGITGTEAKGTARGDLVLHGKARLLDTNLMSVGVGLAATLPTATDGQYTGVDGPSGRLLALATFVPHPRLTITANVGGVVRKKATAALITQGSGLAYGAAVTFRALDKLWIAGEVFGETVPSGQKATTGAAGAMTTTAALSPIEGLLGVTYRLERRVNVGLAVGRGLSSSIGAPSARGVLSITYAPGTPELKPIHPPPPPKVDGDADGDGIKDSKDQCDNEPEDFDQFQDDDGCPDPDNDNDGIADAADKCPLDPEDKDKFQDTDGCPDKDNDNDGIPDDKDKCPDKAEDKDGFQDLDGCPDPDNDNDGIPDEKDKCVDQPETINGITDDDGCPDKGDSVVVVSPDRLETLEAIQFAASSPKITKASFNVLGQVAATLRAHPEIIRVRVTTHVQPSGNAAKDQELTEKRATAVRDWLIQWGIASNRLDARGFGGTKTLVPATNPGSAAVNERLELIILERK